MVNILVLFHLSMHFFNIVEIRDYILIIQVLFCRCEFSLYVYNFAISKICVHYLDNLISMHCVSHPLPVNCVDTSHLLVGNQKCSLLLYTRYINGSRL